MGKIDLDKEIRKHLRGKSREEVSSAFFQWIRAYCEEIEPDEALRTLFDIDTRLYGYQSKTSVAYGNGVHPKHRHMKYHDFFVNRVSKGERVLDMGCGIGAVAFDMASRSGAKVFGYDIDPKNIQQAKESFQHENVHYEVLDVLKKSFEEPFDVVVFSNVLEHLPNRPQLLKKLKQTTGAKRFLIRVPMFDREWRVPLKKELGVDYRLDPTHEIEFTKKIFLEEMAEAELIIKELEVRWGEIWSEVSV
ncbi:MAG: class I SAM-dependent methyltransferase [Verrucomicrobiota bacterium]